MMRQLLFSLVVLLLAPVAFAEPTAIFGKKVWTGTSQGTISNGVVVIDGGRIVSVGSMPLSTSPPRFPRLRRSVTHRSPVLPRE